MPQLVDPNFSRTVVLLCKHNDDGAFGLVVNRPLVTTGRVSSTSIRRLDRSELRSGSAARWSRSAAGCWLAASWTREDSGGCAIADGLYLSTSPDLLRRLLEPDRRRTRD